jgi:hypothetical protein
VGLFLWGLSMASKEKLEEIMRQMEASSKRPDHVDMDWGMKERVRYEETLLALEKIKHEQFMSERNYPSDANTTTAAAKRMQYEEMKARVQLMQHSVDKEMQKAHMDFFANQFKNSKDFQKYYEGSFEDVWKGEQEPDWSKGQAAAPQKKKFSGPDDFLDAVKYGSSSFSAAAYFDELEKKKHKPKPEDITMANKFLPFIVEKSTPEHIYNTLLQRSKGMNINLVTSIFYMVLEKGVVELREYVKTMPEGISVTHMYEEMVGKFAHYQIMDEDLQKFTDLAPLLGTHDWAAVDPELTKQFESKDILAFLYVMGKLGKLEEYTTLNFGRYLSDASDVLTNLPQFITFSDNGKPYEFYSAAELKTFILYHSLLKTEKEDPVPVVRVVIKEKKDDNAL